ncbi:hypothetical protein [Dermatobacter hominis]|uniref:hypothetical protein n=1 Tax=Dermatobacter hominis TaxID=2884263 RepID=UPI001D128DD5|nr:hypothetical protein [Dermatobacter hominis]UDY37820.1 hypothetical protein LH044_09820 [Dermatobacter hominis]
MSAPLPSEAPAPLTYDVVDRGGSPDRLLVLVHGYGLPISALTDRLHLIDPDGALLAVTPHGPYRHRDRVIWHKPARSTGAEEQYLGSLAALDRLLGTLEVATGLAASEAVVGGFSQGGGLGVSLLLHRDVVHRPAAAFGIYSFPAGVHGFPVDRRAAAGRPAFLSGARRDRFATIDTYRGGAGLIASTGVDLTYVEDDADHDMSDLAASEVGAWLAAVRAGAAPSGAGRELYDGVAPPAHYDGLWELLP